jgi:hypothetical protein
MNPGLLGNKYKHKCPGNDVFVRVFSHDASLKEKEELIDHVLKCQKCRTKFEVLNAVKHKSQPQVRPYFPRFSWKFAVAAAAVFLAVIISAVFIVFRPADQTLRGNAPSELVLLKPDEKVSGPPTLFIWKAPENANGYRFKLVNDDLETLYHKTLKEKEGTEISLPQDIQKKLTPGKTYIWSVEAYDDEGNYVALASKSFVIE